MGEGSAINEAESMSHEVGKMLYSMLESLKTK